VGDYRAARIGAAAAFSAVLVFLLIFDAVSVEYSASEIVVSLLLGGIVTLLGIEAGQWLRGR
jgi:hypothetical protein